MSPKKFLRKLWTEWVRPLALPLVVIAAAKSSFADINYVPSGSMQPTILCGDVVFINKLAYDLKIPFTRSRLAQWSDPARGDIVVCFSPADDTRLVKRVVGLPGDTVELRRNTLFLNGTPLRYSSLSATARGPRDLEPVERNASVFAREQLGAHTHAVMGSPALVALRDFGPVRIPAGKYFVMGDNRDNSNDSRYFGVVPRREIIGEAKGVFVSGDLAHWLRPRFDRFFSGLE
ncbi:MAG TPA: signal peptidase I [Opitutaceae bacterium]|nr:signal peptidase I [Opitutaceae bacterium]